MKLLLVIHCVPDAGDTGGAPVERKAEAQGLTGARRLGTGYRTRVPGSVWKNQGRASEGRLGRKISLSGRDARRTLPRQWLRHALSQNCHQAFNLPPAKLQGKQSQVLKDGGC